MIQLTVEEYGDGGAIWFTNQALAFLGAKVDDTLIFDDGKIVVQYANGEIGQTFAYMISKATDVERNAAT